MTRARDLSKIVNNKMTVFKYTATASQTTFTGADDNSATLSYNPNSIIVTYNGIVLENVSEYTATNGTSVVLATGATVGSEVNIIAFEDIAYSGVMPTTGGTFTGNVNVNGNVGVGTSSPDRNLHVKKTDTGGTVAKFENSAGSSFIEMASSAGGGANGGYIEYNATKDFKFAPGDTNRMVIKADGKVGIGIEAPQAPLHIEAPDNSELMNFTVTGNERWALRGESGAGSRDMIGLGISGGTQAAYWHEDGIVTKPNQPAFFARHTTAAAYTSAYITNWSSVTYNVGNHFNGSTGVFTSPVAGVYQLNAMIGNNYANGIGNYEVRVNNNTFTGFIFDPFASQNTWATNVLVGQVKVNANDTVRIYVNGAGYPDNSSWTSWSMYLLG